MRISDFLSEHNGDGSNIRLAVLLVILTILGNWTGANIINALVALKATEPIPMTLVPLSLPEIIAIIGMAGVKVFQKGKENSGDVPQA